MQTRVLVCGGREYRDADQMHTMLSASHSRLCFSVVIEGEAPGADSLARDWAQLHKIPVEPYYAEWELFGPNAGSMRNSKMLREGRPDLIIAFPGDTGTADMVKKGRAANVTVIAGTWSNGPGSKINWKKL